MRLAVGEHLRRFDYERGETLKYEYAKAAPSSRLKPTAIHPSRLKGPESVPHNALYRALMPRDTTARLP